MNRRKTTRNLYDDLNVYSWSGSMRHFELLTKFGGVPVHTNRPPKESEERSHSTSRTHRKGD